MKRFKALSVIVFTVLFVFSFALSAAAQRDDFSASALTEGAGNYNWVGYCDCGSLSDRTSNSYIIYKYKPQPTAGFTFPSENITCSTNSTQVTLSSQFPTEPLKTALEKNSISITLYDDFFAVDLSTILVVKGSDVKVNINAHDFGSTSSAVQVAAGAKLTVSDSSGTGNAFIYGQDASSELVVESGNITVSGKFKSITVKGGSVYGSRLESTIHPQITVTGGSIRLEGVNTGNSALSGSDYALKVTGGTADLTDFSLSATAGPALIVSGGNTVFSYTNPNGTISSTNAGSPAIKISGGKVSLNEINVDDRNVSISSVSDTCIENTGGELNYAKANITFTLSADNAKCYGIKSSGAAAINKIIDGKISITNRGANSNAYGVYLENAAQLNLTGGSIIMNANNTVSYTANASIVGIGNVSGIIKLDGGSVTADTAGASVVAHAVKNSSANAANELSNGIVSVIGTDNKAAAVFNSGSLKFTGGLASASGSGTSAVMNYGNTAFFSMGTHGQGADSSLTPGGPGYPKIQSGGDLAYGLYNENENSSGNARAVLYAGDIVTTGRNAIGIRAQSGNVQVLTNAHTPDLNSATDTVFTVNCLGQNSTAFYIEDSDWAIRGSGSLFAADSALYVIDGSKTDGGLYEDADCSSTANTGAFSKLKPLSGGAFRGSIECKDKPISDLLFVNFYIRDDTYTGDVTSTTTDPDEYCRLSDGAGAALDARRRKLDGNIGQDFIVTNALWGIREAFNNSNGNFALACDIDLGATNGGTANRHGMPGNVGPGPIIIADGVHILNLNGFTLSCSSGGSVIEVQGGELTVVNSKETGSVEGTDDAITVSGGILNVGTNKYKGSVTTSGASAIRLIEGEVNVFSGRIAPTTSIAAQPNACGIIQSGGTLNVYGLSSNGAELPSAGTDRTVISGKDKDLYIKDSSSTIVTNIYGGSFSGGTYGVYVENSDTNSAVNIINPYLICGNGSGDATGVYVQSGNVKVTGGNILYLDELANPAIKLGGDSAYVIISAENAHNIGVVEAKYGRLDIDDANAFGTEIYGINADSDGSVLLSGGTVSSTSLFEGNSELLAIGGTFSGNLTLSGSARAVFTGDGSGASVLGTLTVRDAKGSGNAGVTDKVLLLVDKGTFNSVVRQYKDGDSIIQLHGGLYRNISNGVVNAQYLNISENRYSGLLEDGTTKIKTNCMLGYGHYIVGSDTGKMYNTALPYASAEGDSYMRVRHITDDDSEFNIYAVLGGKTDTKTYKMPADIDLTALANNKVDYSFRGADRSFNCGSSETRTVPLTVKSGSYTLDLNGYELTASEEGKSPLKIDGGTLTIIDSSDVNTGNFYGNIWDGAGDSTILISAGTLNLESGRLVNSKSSVVEMNGGTFNVKGGLLDSLSGNSVYLSSGLVNISDGTLMTTSGSNVCAAGGNVYVSGGTIRADSGTSFSMSGDSSLNLSGGSVMAYANGIKHESTGDLNISGGSIDGRSVAVCVDNPGANAAVSNGILGLDNNTEYGLIIENANTVHLTGGFFKSITTNDPELKTLASLVPFGSTMDTESKPYGIKASAVSANDNKTYSTTNQSIINLISGYEPDAPSLYLSETQITGAADLTDNTVSFGSFTPDTTKSVKVYTFKRYWDKNKDSKPDDSTVLEMKYSLSANAPTETNYVWVSDGGQNYDVIKHWVYHPMFEVTGESKPANEEPTVIMPDPEKKPEEDKNNNNQQQNNNNQQQNNNQQTSVPSGYPSGYVPYPYVVANYNNMPSTLEVETHLAYLQGFSGGLFNPDAGLTRAQAACVFYRLLENKNTTGKSNFKDIPTSHWAYTEINALSQRGIINGYSDGTFKPNKYITRAEFCAIASRFFNLRPSTKQFSDVSDKHWAYNYICSAASYDWVNGMGGGMFYPDYNITRGQAVKIVNSMLGRKADKDYVDKKLSSKYKDLSKTHIFYYEILEASTDHKYTKKNDGESWVSHS